HRESNGQTGRSGRICHRRADQKLRLVGQYRFRSSPHAMVDRQQRREWRPREGQEADGRAGREYSTRQGGGGGRGRPRHHRQLQWIGPCEKRRKLFSKIKKTKT